jgi:hypothetical protein
MTRAAEPLWSTGDATGARRPEGALRSAADVSAEGSTDRERQDPSTDGGVG